MDDVTLEKVVSAAIDDSLKNLIGDIILEIKSSPELRFAVESIIDEFESTAGKRVPEDVRERILSFDDVCTGFCVKDQLGKIKSDPTYRKRLMRVLKKGGLSSSRIRSIVKPNNQ